MGTCHSGSCNQYRLYHEYCDDEKDKYGTPRALVNIRYGENDTKLVNHAVENMKLILKAARGELAFAVPDTQHLWVAVAWEIIQLHRWLTHMVRLTTSPTCSFAMRASS